MKGLALHWKILIGLTLGVVWAVLSSALGWSSFTINWIGPFGTIFINLLKLIAVPLVFFSIVKGITDLSDATRLGRMGAKTLGFYLLTTIMAVSIGLAVVNVIQPGKLVAEEQRITNRISYELWVQETAGVAPLDNINLLADPAYAEQVSKAQELLQQNADNEFVASSVGQAENTKDAGPLQFLIDLVPSNLFAALGNNGQMLQIIFFALFLGATLVLLPRDKTQTILNLVDGFNEVFLKMVDVVMMAAPVFVFALLAGKIAEMAGDDPAQVWEIFKGLAWYSLCVVLGLLTLLYLIYPMIMALIASRKTDKSYWEAYVHFNQSMSPAQLMAFSTSSSVATLPVTMECVNERLGVPEEVSSFVLPIGATVNMDGTSLYQAVAVVFLAQFHMVDLSLGQQLTIILTATLASIGSAAVPSAGLIMLIIVLQSVGLNPAWIAIIFPVDRILDMCRTVINVTGDACVSSLVAITEGRFGEEYLEHVEEVEVE